MPKRTYRKARRTIRKSTYRKKNSIKKIVNSVLNKKSETKVVKRPVQGWSPLANAITNLVPGFSWQPVHFGFTQGTKTYVVGPYKKTDFGNYTDYNAAAILIGHTMQCTKVNIWGQVYIGFNTTNGGDAVPNMMGTQIYHTARIGVIIPAPGITCGQVEGYLNAIKGTPWPDAMTPFDTTIVRVIKQKWCRLHSVNKQIMGFKFKFRPKKYGLLNFAIGADGTQVTTSSAHQYFIFFYSEKNGPGFYVGSTPVTLNTYIDMCVTCTYKDM